MTEKQTPEAKPNKKGPIGKLKDIAEDKEEQLQIIGVAVRLGVVIWSGFIVTLNYITIPGYSSDPKDITFPASLLTGALASFGLEGAKKRGDGTYKSEDEKPMNKKEIQAMLSEQSSSFQTIRIETPIKLVPQEPKIDPITGKTVNPQSGKLT